MMPRFKGRSVAAAITAGVLLCGATAQASNVELSLEERGSITQHATMPVPTAAAPNDDGDTDFWPVLVAVVVAAVTMGCDYAPSLPDAQYGEAAFD